jgi:hypothetical protein
VSPKSEKGDTAMDGIQTRVYCPECGKEIELLLKRQIIPGPLLAMMKAMSVDAGNDHAYKGEMVCSCGKTVKATFVIEAFSENKRPQREFIVSGGN